MAMRKRFLIIGLLLLFFLLPTIVSATTFKPGDTLSPRFPQSGMATIILEKPKYVRWTLFDPNDNVVFEEDHELTYLKETIGWGIAWEFYDQYSIRVPAFAVAGEWKISGRVFSEFLWVIEDPSIGAIDYRFQVEDVSFVENLFAPWYYTTDAGFFAGRMNLSLPFHPYLIFIVIGAIIAIILIVRFVINIAVKNGGNEK